MNEENKYYTPDVTEFKLGFQYEFRHPDYKELGWKLYLTPEFNSELEDCVFVNNMSCFRVKYLSKEDVKSLGFKEFYIPELKDGDFAFDFNNGHIIVQHIGKEPIITIYYFGERHFFGKIKNKSELKTLLTQLGIEYGK